MMECVGPVASVRGGSRHLSGTGWMEALGRMLHDSAFAQRLQSDQRILPGASLPKCKRRGPGKRVIERGYASRVINQLCFW